VIKASTLLSGSSGRTVKQSPRYSSNPPFFMFSLRVGLQERRLQLHRRDSFDYWAKILKVPGEAANVPAQIDKYI